MARRPLRLLHTADVHLGSGRAGDAEVLSRIVDRALTDHVDLLLIAGDLFDHNRVPDETIELVRTELQRLRQPVVILPGNHDVLCTSSIHDRYDLTAGARHIHVIRRLDGETIDLPELDVVVWGRAMEDHGPGFRPLANVPGRHARRWCVAMAHGFFYPERQAPERSSPIFADEIRDAGWDYIALGHQHVQTDVSQGAVAAYYAGAPVLEWARGHQQGAALAVDFSERHGVRVERRLL